jgi:NAD(P)-dependent dehydrogenase (short-subunit alcohol dehydrogenase family)
MQIAGKVVAVTGGARGIGRALCETFHRAGAAKIIVADRDLQGAEAVAASVGGAAFGCDVGNQRDIRRLIEETETTFGPIALFCSNAGIARGFDPATENAGGDPDEPNADEPWTKSWAIHVMAHVYAARHLVPRMKARGEGYFLNTISAAGLAARFIRRPSMRRWVSPKVSRSHTRHTESESRSCVRRASIPTCCGRSQRGRNRAMAILRPRRWRRMH